MVTEADLPQLAQRALWAGFGLGALFGAVAQRTHFCTMGAVADIVHIGDWTRMRMWVLAIGVAIIGFNSMVSLGWVEASQSIYAGDRLIWLSHAIGGLMFGVGMVLASGCGSKTLVRVGGGNLKALVVFLVLGVSAFATLKGIGAVARTATLDRVVLNLPSGQDLPSLLAAASGMAPATWAGALGGAIGLALMAWALARPEGRGGDVLLGGLGIGALTTAAWWVSGRLGHLAEHPLTLEPTFLATNSGRMEALSFVAPIAYTIDWLLFFSDANKLLTLGVVICLGVVAGSAAVALATRSFRWEGFAGVEDTANHIVGALLMGVGGVTAMGCTIGQGLSGLSTLSIGSAIAVAGIVAGAVLGVQWQTMRLERQA